MIVDFPLTCRRARRCSWLVLFVVIGLGGVFSRSFASQSVELTWNPSPNANIVAYNVYFGTESRSYPDCITFDDVSDVIIPDLAGGQTYYFAVSAIDANGIESELSNEASYAVPGSSSLVLQAQETSPTSQDVELTWNPSPESDVYGYTVYYGTQSGVYTNSATYYSTTDVILSGLAGGATYYFAVAPIDSYGVESNLSNEASVALPVATPLVLQAQQVSPTSQDVQLSWSASPNSDVYGYMVYYGTQRGVYTNSTAFYDTTSGVVSGLIGGRTYYFAVGVIDANGVENPLSNEASVAVPVQVPLVLQAQGALPDFRQVQLTWSASPNSDVYAYQVFYGTQRGVYTNSATFYYTTTGFIPDLAGGMTYYFAVAPIGANGVGNLLSNVASYAVPVPPPIVLQTQTYTDGNGQLYDMQISTTSAVSGSWEMDSSTDLQNWSPYTYGYGYGNGDGYDVNVDVWIDPAQPQVFFRVMNY
jgi:fibronectin type 3 domain-containing protein